MSREGRSASARPVLCLCPGCDDPKKWRSGKREAWSCFLFRCGPKQHVNWTGAKKAVFDSLSEVEGIEQERKSTRDPKRVNKDVLVNHLRTKAADPDFQRFFRNNPHLCQYGRGFTYLIGPNPATVPEISPSRSFPRDLGGSSSGANQQQLLRMPPIPLSPGAPHPASDGIPFPLGQDMKGQGGMLSF